MYPKPRSVSLVGVVQTFLAASFVVWLLFFPQTGTNFAWPIAPALSAMFLGTSFMLRTFLGYHLWQERNWYRLRWLTWGNFAFLGVIFVATFWHLDQMNWQSNIIVAHIWVVAYVVEPLTLILIEPRGDVRKAPWPAELAQGPILPGLKRVLAGIFVLGVTIGGMFLINPKFADTRWPWPLDPFDARVMAAWPAACAVWAATMYFKEDWGEIKTGVQALLLYGTALFAVWVATFGTYDPTRKNGLTFGVATGLGAALLAYYYWRQEVARRKAVAPAPAQAGR